jgi:hypothetical protein
MMAGLWLWRGRSSPSSSVYFPYLGAGEGWYGGEEDMVSGWVCWGRVEEDGGTS